MRRQGDEVKAGQVLGFIEQLGTFMPVEVSLCLWLCPALSVACADATAMRAWLTHKSSRKIVPEHATSTCSLCSDFHAYISSSCSVDLRVSPQGSHYMVSEESTSRAIT